MTQLRLTRFISNFIEPMLRAGEASAGTIEPPAVTLDGGLRRHSDWMPLTVGTVGNAPCPP